MLAMDPFGDIEDQIHPVGQEPARQIRGGFNGMNRVAGQPEGTDNGFDRPLSVKLGLPIERDAVPLVDVAFEVVRQRDGVGDRKPASS